MAQIISGPTRGEQLAGMLGQSLGTGLNSLINNKLEKMKTIQGLTGIFGAQKAKSLASLPPEIAKLVIPQELKSMQHQKNLEALQQQYGMGSGMQALQQGAPGIQQPQQGQPLSLRDLMSSQQPKQQEVIPGYQPGKIATQAYTAGTDIGRAMGMEQKERLARQRQLGKVEAEKEKRITQSLNEARTQAKDLNDRIEGYDGSIKAYEQVRSLIKGGKPLTGLPIWALKKFGLDKSIPGWQTQLTEKILAGEPIRALKYLPAQAARLSKVFDTLKDMHGSMLNTKQGLGVIARTKITEAKTQRAIDKEYLGLLEKYRKSGKEVPFDLKQVATKNVAPKLNKYGAELQYITSDYMERSGAKLKNYKFGKTIRTDDGNEVVFKKEMLFGKPTWVAVKE